MIQKRHIILSVILLVALNLTFSIAQAVDWNNVETCSFMVNKIYLWNHVDETTIITAYRGWLPILAPVLILLFALTILMVMYTKGKFKK